MNIFGWACRRDLAGQHSEYVEVLSVVRGITSAPNAKWQVIESRESRREVPATDAQALQGGAFVVEERRRGDQDKSDEVPRYSGERINKRFLTRVVADRPQSEF